MSTFNYGAWWRLSPCGTSKDGKMEKLDQSKPPPLEPHIQATSHKRSWKMKLSGSTLTSRFGRWSIVLEESSERGHSAPRRASGRCAGSADSGWAPAAPRGATPSLPGNNREGSCWAWPGPSEWCRILVGWEGTAWAGARLMHLCFALAFPRPTRADVHDVVECVHALDDVHNQVREADVVLQDQWIHRLGLDHVVHEVEPLGVL